MKKLGINPVTNDIVYATVQEIKEGVYRVTGKEEVITDSVLRMAFQWLEIKYKEQKKQSPIGFSFGDSEFLLAFGKKDEIKVKGENKDESN